MKLAVRLGTALSKGWLAVLFCLAAAPWSDIRAQTSDFLFDEGQLSPVEAKLGDDSERKAEAITNFLTGIFEEETSGPEAALASFRRVLALDPGYTQLAIEVAYDYLRCSESAEAIGVLKDAIKARPDDPEPSLALSSIYLRHLRKPDLATRYAEMALKADPTRFAAYEALWEIAQAQGDEDEADRVLDRALKTKRADTEFWLQLAEFFTSSTDADPIADKAAADRLSRCLKKAADSATDNAESLVRIADFYVLARELETAADFYTRALDLNSNLDGANEKLADVLIGLGKSDDAVPVLERVVAMNPLNLRAYDKLWQIYSEKGEDEKALKSIEQALIIDSADYMRQQGYLTLLLRTGRTEEAIEHSQEAMKLFPQSAIMTYIAAKALSIAHRDEEALALFERSLLQFSNTSAEEPRAYFYLDFALAAERAGRDSKAEELLRRAVEIEPENAQAMNALGYFWVDRNENLEDGGELIRKALEIEPENGAILDSMGWYHYRVGDYQAAIDELLRAAKAIAEPDAVVFEHVGDAYHALGRTAEAVLYWQKAAAIDPKNSGLISKLDHATGKVASKPSPETKAD